MLGLTRIYLHRPFSAGFPRIEHVHSGGMSRQGLDMLVETAIPQKMNLPRAKYVVQPMSASLFPMVVHAQEESPAWPYRVYHHNKAERCPSFQTISNSSLRGYLMHGLDTEPCLFTGRGARLTEEHADVDTLSPSVSDLKILNGVAK